MRYQQCVARGHPARLKSLWLVVTAICAGLLVGGLLFTEHQVTPPWKPAIYQILGKIGAGDWTNTAVTVIVASQEGDNTTWLEPFTDWAKAIYVTDDESAALAVPRNKGKEGMVYLTYIIEHYDHLPKIMIFSHSDRYQWHNDDPLYDGQAVLSRLNLAHVVSRGYTSLRCGWSIGCPKEIRPHAEAESPPPASDPNSKGARAGAFYKDAFEHLFPNVSVPDIVARSLLCPIRGHSRSSLGKAQGRLRTNQRLAARDTIE